MLACQVSLAENHFNGFSNLDNEFPIVPVILVSRMVVVLSILATLKLTKKKISLQKVSGEAEVQKEIQQEECKQTE